MPLAQARQRRGGPAEPIVLAEQALRSRDAEALREAALGVAQLALTAERPVSVPPPSLVQARRVARAVRYIERRGAGQE